MKKLLALALALLMICGVAACAETAPETIVLQTFDGDSQPIELKVPYDPQRIVVLDMACLDILVCLGME